MPKTSEQRHLDEARLKELLGGIPLPEHAKPAPDRADFIYRATAASERQSNLLTRTKQRYLMVAAASAVIAILAFASNYWTIPLPGWIRHPAWAEVNGFMLEYDRICRIYSEYDRVYSIGSRTGEPDTDLILATRVAESLSAKYADQDKAVEGRPVLSFHSSKDRRFAWWLQRTYRFVVLSDDPELIAELTEYMRGYGAVTAPRKTPLQFYYKGEFSEPLTRSQRYFQQGRKIIVDDREYRIPQDVNPEYLDRLQQEFEVFGNYLSYNLRAYWIPGQLYYSPRLPNPMGVGQLCLVTLNDNGDMVVTTLQETLDIEIPDELYAGLRQQVPIEEGLDLDSGTFTRYDFVKAAKAAGCKPTISRSYSPASSYAQAMIAEKLDPVGLHGKIDPIEEILLEVGFRAELNRAMKERPAVHRFAFPVFPEQSWQQVVDGIYRSEDTGFSAEAAIKYSKELVDAAKFATRRFESEHPECRHWDWGRSSCVSSLVLPGSPALVISAHIYTDDENLAQEYKQLMMGTLQLGEPLSYFTPAIHLSDDTAVDEAEPDDTAGAIHVWPTPDHLSRYYGPRECNLLWKRQVGDLTRSFSITADGTIYAVLMVSLKAVNPDGSLKWHYAPYYTDVFSPLVGKDSTVYCSSRDFRILALTSEGRRKWHFINQGRNSTSLALDNEDTVYFGNETGDFYALNKDGSVKWQSSVLELMGQPIDEQAEASLDYGDIWINDPALGADGSIYFSASVRQPLTPGTPRGRDSGEFADALLALDSDGSLKWRQRIDGLCAAPAVAKDGSIYTVSTDGALYALSPEGGRRWSFSAGEVISSSPAVGPDGEIVFGTMGGCVYALNPDGTLNWRYDAKGGISVSPAIGADGIIYVGSQGHVLYALSPEGELLWSYETEGGIECAPAIGVDGTVYVGDKKGSIYAFGHQGSAE